MEESSNNKANRTGEEEEDYMGDLSRFISSEALNPPKPSSAKASNNSTQITEFSKKKFKTLNWQEQRKLNREKNQIEEDEQTLKKIEAPIPQSNIGFKMLKQMGYTPGSALGKEGSGRAEPVVLEIRRSRAGIGREDPHKEKKRTEVIKAERKRKNEEALMEEFGSRQKLQWRSRRVVVNYEKAKRVLDQLENREVVELQKNEDDEEGGEENEEVEITEEDLQDILMKLRDEHWYCLFCGFQYDSAEALLLNCPGINEDDH